ncbi:MAG: DUF805 domain-containing protein, partial [Alphaproteobacteria bacterium GM202ARS2]|nr:DUF805 domain-containing protein [Alphaproteobacteria bacterium GM202ARS2]
GRAPRSEYWWFVLFEFLALIVASTLFVSIEALGDGLSVALLIITVLALVLPHLAVTVRRLHDIDVSGWWVGLLWLIAVFASSSDAAPFVNFLLTIVLLIATLLPGNKGHNRFGDDPRDSNR